MKRPPAIKRPHPISFRELAGKPPVDETDALRTYARERSRLLDLNEAGPLLARERIRMAAFGYLQDEGWTVLPLQEGTEATESTQPHKEPLPFRKREERQP